jgi:hypothetical protein
METHEEYMRSFEENTKELLVRIVWFPEKAPDKPQSVAGLLKMQARFDEAIDMESGERIGKGLFNWLEWTYKKKLFGDPFGYTMKKDPCTASEYGRKQRTITPVPKRITWMPYWKKMSKTDGLIPFFPSSIHLKMRKRKCCS